MKPIECQPIEELLPRYCDGCATDEECLRVEAWIDESEDNKRIATQIFTLHLATDTVQVMKTVDTEKAMKRAKRRMRSGRQPKISVWLWLQRVAAVLFIPLLGFYIWQDRNQEETLTDAVVEMMTVKTSPGMTASFTLPDGTLAFLNSESSLSYPSHFSGDSREVRLSGEAYLEVAKDSKKKFILSTPHRSQIEVLGTRFNIEAYEHKKHVTTTLVEGKVNFQFEDNAAKKRITLLPGHKLVYDNADQETVLYETSGETELAWKDGKVILNNTPLKDALWMLEKRYSVEFVIKNERLRNTSFTGTFTNQRLEKILEYFRISSHIRWRYVNTGRDGSDREKEKIELF